MKLKTLAVGLCTIALLAGCGSKGDDAGKSEKEDKTIRIGASVTPHAEIIRHIQPVLEKEGYTLDIKEYTDYNKMNQALADDDMDANFSSISSSWITGQKMQMLKIRLQVYSLFTMSRWVSIL